ncbi:MAG: MoaD/ThiS family protein [Bacteroidetes bacterium]|nr:MoaD/ThiS family protein [Bacteroidota bacterium]MDA1121926.1 MoaD/ThiS family protein [Bacteroidota bacterium]
MKLTIIAYGIARDILGSNSIEYEIEDSVSHENLLENLKKTYPDFNKLTSLMIAINSEYAKKGQMISENDEVVLIPPVSGG